MNFNITDRVTWVGKTDWELKWFHGYEYSVHKGSSYNSYLIRDQKTVLIDTVWQPFAQEFVARLKDIIDLADIDYIIANHAEIDHSGALPALLREIPETPVYCSTNGIKSLKGHFHEDWNFVPVNTGDSLDIGSSKLIFIEAPMLHWPDSMFTYLTGDNILFSNDAFGQHYASEFLYNDLVDQGELFHEAMKYYANILNPFSRLVKRKIEELLALKVPVDMICPSHGVIWRQDPLQIVNKYLAWSQAYQEDQITIIYDTMWNGTRRMAEAIADGIAAADSSTEVKLFNSAKSDRNDILTEVFKSKAILVGSPTVNRSVLASTSTFLDVAQGLAFKNKSAAAFGTYGWSGESVDLLTTRLKEAGFNVVSEGIKTTWNPDSDALARCHQFGQQFVGQL
ncbi:MAG: anaerobic nitric oxide reductase flavorubredoxin [Firmicutes bacterium]|nr:anaerobic nitric oxide reductase flavorubredoxin [Bacillota bacterium]